MRKDITPQSVSRALHDAGLATVPRHSRDGLSASRTHNKAQVRVSASVVGSPVGSNRQERELIALAADALLARGYSIDLRTGYALLVSKQVS